MKVKYVLCSASLIVRFLLHVKLLSQAGFPDVSGLSSEDQTSIKSACSTAKYVGGPAPYHECLQKQLNALSGSRLPDVSGLRSEDQNSIKSSWSTAKYVGRPASYHQ